MTCNITSTPFIPEPLPLYQPRARDPETASVLSSAPSYISEAPTYVSNRQSTVITGPPQPSSLLPPRAPNERSVGLPAIRYAEGFQNPARGRMGDLTNHSYNICSWSSIYKSPNARQLQNVAARRASKASASPLFSALTSDAPPTASASTTLLASTATTTDANAITAIAGPSQASSSATPSSSFPADIPTAPFSPLEDPYLVGESAAAQARAQRIYREMCLRSDEACKNEGKSWDFLLAQMVDWDERERSWTRFRQDVGNRSRKLLDRRMGMHF